MTIKITTGTYNTSDYKIVKEYKSEKAALKFANLIGFKGNEVYNNSWSSSGRTYNMSIN
jgi:hypothetical protein